MAITADTINELYRRFRRQPKRLEDRNLSLLVDYVLDTEVLDMDGEKLVFTGMPQSSPFREIELERVNGVADLPEAMAVVLPNSIIFINKSDLSAHVHIRQIKMPLRQRLRRIFGLGKP